MYKSRDYSQLELGYKCNMLTVVSAEYPANRSTPARYDCICDCGNTVSQIKSKLRAKKPYSCGCITSKNIIGQKFNRLTVISVDRVEKHTDVSGTKQTVKFYNCKCDCGNLTIVRQSGVKTTKSCGCQQTLSNKERRTDITGEKFGRLTVEKLDEATGKWICSCECGGESLSKLSSLRRGESQSCGCLQKEKASISISNQHKEKRRSRGLPEDVPMATQYALERQEFKPLSSAIMKRDFFTCAWCSQKAGELHVHHLETWMSSPELRFTKSNLVTLCVSCHKKVHVNGNTNPVDPYMTILLQGYANVMEDGYSARIELTPN